MVLPMLSTKLGHGIGDEEHLRRPYAKFARLLPTPAIIGRVGVGAT